MYVSNYEYNLNERKSTERNFPPLRFSCLNGLKVSGPEIRHLPANHPVLLGHSEVILSLNAFTFYYTWFCNFNSNSAGLG